MYYLKKILVYVFLNNSIIFMYFMLIYYLLGFAYWNSLKPKMKSSWKLIVYLILPFLLFSSMKKMAVIMPVSYESVPTIQDKTVEEVYEDAALPHIKYVEGGYDGESYYYDYEYGEDYTLYVDSPVYITPKGEKYHYFSDCYSIKDHTYKAIKHIDALEILNRKVCDICQKRLNKRMEEIEG